MTTATAAQLTRILLLGDRKRPSGQDAPAIRRYRLARLQLNERPSRAGRFEHLRRSYD